MRTANRFDLSATTITHNRNLQKSQSNRRNFRQPRQFQLDIDDASQDAGTLSSSLV